MGAVTQNGAIDSLSAPAISFPPASHCSINYDYGDKCQGNGQDYNQGNNSRILSCGPLKSKNLGF
jgi:hypothetical protein